MALGTGASGIVVISLIPLFRDTVMFLAVYLVALRAIGIKAVLHDPVLPDKSMRFAEFALLGSAGLATAGKPMARWVARTKEA